MRSALALVAVVLVVGLPDVAVGQPVRVARYEQPLTERLYLESTILGGQREFFVGLPHGYKRSGAAYPLIVVLDGETVFETFSALARLMADVGEIPPSIVVGIPNRGGELDYAPKLADHPESGRADVTLEHFGTELFPALDSIYGLGKDRVIWGHSAIGGLFCTYLLLGPDTQFTGILSSSPNLQYTQEYIDRSDTFSELAGKQRVFYYLTFGDREAPAYVGEMFRRVKDFAGRLERGAPENVIWRYKVYSGNNHFTNAVETYIDGLKLYFQVMHQAAVNGT